MPLSSLLLVVLAALLHASWNLLAKRAAYAGAAFVFAYSAIAGIVYLPWIAWLAWHGELAWSAAIAAGIVASAILHLGYSIALQRGYQAADLSVVYPVARGTGPMLSSLAAILLLGEHATAPGLAGLLLVVAGIALISTDGRLARFTEPGATAGIRWGLLIGALIATYTVVDGYGVGTLGTHPVLLDWCSNLLRAAMLAPLVLRDRPRAMGMMRGHWWRAAAVGVISPFAYILVLGAIRLGAPIHLVAPAREMSMMAGALLGMAILREPVGRWRLAGCAVLVAGVVLLASG